MASPDAPDGPDNGATKPTLIGALVAAPATQPPPSSMSHPQRSAPQSTRDQDRRLTIVPRASLPPIATAAHGAIHVSLAGRTPELPCRRPGNASGRAHGIAERAEA